MSCDDHYRRRAAIATALDFAARHPDAGLPYETLPDVQAQFRDRRELVLALQYEWAQALWVRIELLSLDRGRTSRRTKPMDADELARAAYTACTAAHPVLRRLLDRHRDELGPCLRQERDIMTSAAIGQAG
jgi:hypothetical protein